MKYEKNEKCKKLHYNEVYKFVLRQFSIKCIFYVVISKKTLENQKLHFLSKYVRQNKRWFAKSFTQIKFTIHKVLSIWNFLFHLKSKINLVTLSERNSRLQYYKIDLSFSIKFSYLAYFFKKLNFWFSNIFFRIESKNARFLKNDWIAICGFFSSK